MKNLTYILFFLFSVLSINAQNYCLDFDGVDDYVEVENESAFDFTTSMTVEVWIKVDSFTKYWQAIVTKGSDSWKLDRDFSSNSISFEAGGTRIRSDISLNDGLWHHIAGVHDGSYLYLYVDGNLSDSSSDAGITSTGDYPVLIGENAQVPGRQLDGQIDEVRIWNVARTEQEIENNMNIELAGTETGLVAYYKFEEGSGSIAGDSAGSNDGTLINMEEDDWVDLSLPRVLNLSPADNSLNLDLETDLVIKFDKGVQTGSGNITIHKTSDDSVFETIPAVSTTLIDSTVSIDPVNDFEWGTDYYVLIDSMAFMSIDSFYFKGIYEKTDWNFRSQNCISTLYPADNSVNVDLETDLVIKFNSVMQAASGSITIYKSSDDSVFETISAVSTVISDSTITIDLANDFELQTDYYVLIDSTAFCTSDSIYFDGIYDKTGWNFRSLSFFTDIEAGLTGVYHSSVDWGDYDNDGDLDILLIGTDELERKFSKIYRNDSGVFTDINAGLTGVSSGTATWGDYDNDGDLDILLTGGIPPANRITKVYSNDSGVFIDINAGLPLLYKSCADWGDYDNDGDLDILLTGDAGEPITKIYRNDSGIFTDINAGLIGVVDGSVAWGDYDNDGDLDILLTGSYTSKIYRNNGNNSFTGIWAGLSNYEISSAAWGDYDNDGDLDILLVGYDTSMNNGISKIYRNDSGTFTDIIAGFWNIYGTSASWGDYDNDGDLDILITGSYYADNGFWDYRISKVYNNDSGVFTDINAVLTEVKDGSVAWGDYDNDGDLDILSAGYDNYERGNTKIYRNNSKVFNNAPNAPENLAISDDEEYLNFKFDPATDNETPQSGLSYNIDFEINDVNAKSAMADSSGYRKIVAIGNAGQNLEYKLTKLKVLFPQEDVAPINISWKVQAIDHSFAGSEFACMDTIFLSRDLEIITSNEMESTDLLTWEYVVPDSISNYQLQIDEDINFESPFEDTILLSKKENKNAYYLFALNEFSDFDSLVNNTIYYWRVKPNYQYRTSRYPDIPASFIYNPTYTTPSPVNVSVEGNLVTLTWNDVKDAGKGEVYNVYSSDDPYAVFPDGWKYEATVNGTQWLTTASELKKFYCVTATGSSKEDNKIIEESEFKNENITK